MTWHYTSDSHLHHAGIITHCQRPFGSVGEMTEVIWAHLLDVDQAGGNIVHAGDFALSRGLERLLADQSLRLPGADRHQLLPGNHDEWLLDRSVADQVRGRFFGHIHASDIILEDRVDGESVRVLVTHRPSRAVDGVDFNIYGHLHNNLQRKSRKHQEDFWVEGSPKHFNVCVEMTEYRPMRLQELVDRRRSGVYQW